MGFGDPALPVDDEIGSSNPVPVSGDDQVFDLQNRLRVLERAAGNTDLTYAVKNLYDHLGLPYPPA